MTRRLRFWFAVAMVPAVLAGCSSGPEETLTPGRLAEIFLYAAALVGAIILARVILDFKDTEIR